jgi:hypothetical protein
MGLPPLSVSWIAARSGRGLKLPRRAASDNCRVLRRCKMTARVDGGLGKNDGSAA